MTQAVAIPNIHELLGVRLFKSPPKGFNPLTAKDRELTVHGFPSRPDAKKYPALHARWEQVLSRPQRRLQPQFGIRTDRLHGPRVKGKKVANDTSTNWSGSIGFAPGGDTVNWIEGQWTVPAVIAPGNGDYFSSAWIGIDGDGSNDVLQAGTEHEVVGGAHYTYLWWEWYPGPEIQVTNIPALSGHVMYCLICVLSTTEAIIYLNNITTGDYTSFAVSAPAGTTLMGNCAEWIVEAPRVDGSQSALARYGEVYFDECIAETGKSGLLFGGQGHQMFMIDGGGKTISAPVFDIDRVVRLQYVP
jgi:Peptidase A4 family